MTEVKDSGPKFANFRPQRPERGRVKDKKHGDLLKNLTVKLVVTYSQCSSDFKYTLQQAPRRVLTKLSKGVHNQGHDNAEHDYICRVSDKIKNPDPDNNTYEILERLGHGTFGQVLKCVNPKDRGGTPVALKIIKNKPAYFHQALVEVHILKMLNDKYDPDDEKRIVRMIDFFVYRKHLCIAFELLSVNLYDVLKQNSFRGVSMALIRVLTEQLLKAMHCLRAASVIHCDLKPENVLLSNMQHTRIKLIDFGSACFENHTVYSYIQSRFYRSPEVLLGLPYTTAIDMWSLGCICSELFLGLPIFPGHSEYDQVCRIVEVQGLPPSEMLDIGKNTRKYFRRVEEPLPSDLGDEDMASGSTDCSDSDHGEGEPFPSGPTQQSPPTEQGDEREARMGQDGSDEERPEKQQKPIEHGALTPNGQGVGSAGASDEKHLSKSASPAAAAENNSAPPASPSGVATPPLEEAASSHQAVNSETLVAEQPSGQTEEVASLSDDPTRSESFMDLLKRKVGLQAEPPPSDLAAATAPPSMPDSSPGSVAHVSESEAGCASGSNVSTVADNPETLQRRLFQGSGAAAAAQASEASDTTAAPASGRLASSGDDAERRDGSADTRGEAPMTATASGNSDGVPLPGPPWPLTHKRRVRTFWRLKSREEYERDEHKKEPNPKKYFDFKSIEQMVEQLPYKHSMSRRARAEEEERRQCFLQFLWGILQINPDERWTPKQATLTPFIMGRPFDPDFSPVDDIPVPSFLRFVQKQAPKKQAPKITAEAGSAARHGSQNVPPLPGEVFGQGEGGGSSNSARTWQETQAGPNDDGQPRSAPCSFRGAHAKSQSGATKAPEEVAKEALQVLNDPVIMPNVHPDDMRGLWGHLCKGVPLPDNNPAESYRPPIEQLSEDFFRGVNRSNEAAAAKRKGAVLGSPQTSGAFSSGASASSAGSTPTIGGHVRRRHAAHGNLGSPFSVRSSPMSTGGGTRSGPAPRQHGRHPAGTPSSHGASPLGNVSPHSAASTGPTSGTPIINVHTPQGGVAAVTAPKAPPTGGSRDGSRGSSPWHLPSPMSELSTASERVNSSQPSGSDSCDNIPHDGGGTMSFDDDAFRSGEDPSQYSDGHYPRSASQQPSDSDGNMTPRSHDTAGTNRAEEEKGKHDALWENISKNMKSEMARVDLTKLSRRLDITQSPGSAGAMGNFREKMGLNDSGPVIPSGNVNVTRNAAGQVFNPPYRSSGGAEGSGTSVPHTAHNRPRRRPKGGDGGSGSGTPGSATQ